MKDQYPPVTTPVPITVADPESVTVTVDPLAEPVPENHGFGVAVVDPFAGFCIVLLGAARRTIRFAVTPL